jgi:hypothetical protein
VDRLGRGTMSDAVSVFHLVEGARVARNLEREVD